MRHHPTWSEVREKYLSDPEVAAAAEELHQRLSDLPKSEAGFSDNGEERSQQ